MKLYTKCFAVAAGLILVGCQVSQSPENTVGTYLSLLSKANPSHKEYRCLKGAIPDADPLKSVGKWQVIGSEERIDESDPESVYTQVRARIESTSSAGFPVTYSWDFVVWESDALFENQRRLADRLHRVSLETRETVNLARSYLGESPESIETEPVWVPDRNEVSDEPYCITSLRRVSE